MNPDKQPLVSIGVPTYNRPHTLGRTLRCLVNQTYRRLEIIVSDNCSTMAEVKQVMQDYSSDPRINFIVQPVNKGFTFNFNFVVQQATGDYFMWLADDDWLDEDYIESCIGFLETHPGYTGAYGMAELHDSEGKRIGQDVKINLEEGSPTERVKHYLREVRHNGCFAALTRLKYRPYLELKHEIATDWIIVSRFLITGKYKALETTHLHLSCAGLSSSIVNLTSSMSAFTRMFPHFAISLNVTRDILFGEAYRGLGWLNKTRFAKQCFIIIYHRHLIRTEIKRGMKKLLNLRLFSS